MFKKFRDLGLQTHRRDNSIVASLFAMSVSLRLLRMEAMKPAFRMIATWTEKLNEQEWGGADVKQSFTRYLTYFWVSPRHYYQSAN